MKFNMLGDANHAGPVRLSDVYSSAVGDASTGIAASQKALYDAYSSLNSRITTVNSGIVVKKHSVQAAISNSNKTATFSFTPIKGYHGFVYVTYLLSNGGRYYQAFLTGWGIQEIGHLQQNTIGEVETTGYIENGTYTVSFTISSTNLTTNCWATIWVLI